MAKPHTLFEKIWNAHVVDTQEDGTCLLYIDRHLVHEVTSPQAFDGLRMAGRTVRQPARTLAVADHNVPTKDTDKPIANPESRAQVEALKSNTEQFGIECYGLGDVRQGVCHIVGPEQGFTLPGVTMVCGDSHTATHGAFGAIAFGIGTSEVEHVLATQTLTQQPVKNMRITVEGKLANGITAKDLALYIIGQIGTAGGTGYAIEYAGQAVENLSMEGRMTLCNMTIEAGARFGLIAPDDTTFTYCMGRTKAPKGAAWEHALAYWKTLKTDPDASFDKDITLQAADVPPMVTWGTSPEDVVAISDVVPSPADAPTSEKKSAMERSLGYMGLEAGTPMTDIAVDRIFIGSCTNGRIEDLKSAAAVVKGRKVADGVSAMVVPGSGLVKLLAEELELDKIFKDAGFEWRDAGCSMCLAMNDDQLMPFERCASTSNRNFEGRQGRDGRTHLVSPAMAAAAAVTGKLTDVRTLK